LIVMSKLVLAAMMLLAVLVPAAAADKLMVAGKVHYRERLLLPAGTTLTVSLVDLANPEHPIVSVDAVTADRARSPLDFSLNLAEGVLREGRDYGVTAEIVTAGDRLWFKSALPVALDPVALDVPVEILVVAAGQKPAPEAAIAKLYDMKLEVIALSGAKLVDGLYPTLMLSADLRASGSSGCNNWFAQATLDGDAISFSPAAATRKACPAPGLAAQETVFFAALENVTRWQMRGQQMQLLDAKGDELILLAPLPDV
jgi:putative lipoprotein